MMARPPAGASTNARRSLRRQVANAPSSAGGNSAIVAAAAVWGIAAVTALRSTSKVPAPGLFPWGGAAPGHPGRGLAPVRARAQVLDRQVAAALHVGLVRSCARVATGGHLPKRLNRSSSIPASALTSAPHPSASWSPPAPPPPAPSRTRCPPRTPPSPNPAPLLLPCPPPAAPPSPLRSPKRPEAASRRPRQSSCMQSVSWSGRRD